LETALEAEWLAGTDISVVEYASLSEAERKSVLKEAQQAANAILKEGGKEAVGARKAWIKKFNTEHLRAVRQMEHHSYITDKGQQPCKRYEGAGGISGLYTYGAPGTALVPLNNVLREDGKFPGLRLVTQRVTQFGKFLRKYHDPVPFSAGIIGMKHPHQDLLVVTVTDLEEYKPTLHPTSLEVVNMPRSDLSFWVGGHFQPVYHKHLEPYKEQFDIKAWTLLHMSMAVTPGNNGNSRVGNAAYAVKVGWNLVGQSINDKLGSHDIIYRDNTTLYQDPATKACTLSFVGTHHITQWLVNLRFNPSMFCGIPNVHIGFRNQVRRVIRSKMWSEEVQPKLSSCPELYITGHSLGAAQAQLVAACLQRAPAEGENGWEDYKYLVWIPKPETAAVLPAMVSSEEIAAFNAASA